MDIEYVLKSNGIKYTTEYRFHPVRRWRFDYALPEYKIAIEYEGGTYSGGRHTRGKGYAKDCEKYNRAQSMGWVVLRYTADMIKVDPEAVFRDISEILSRRYE